MSAPDLAAIIEQFLACALTILDIPPETLTRIQQQWTRTPPEGLSDWWHLFYQDLYRSQNGYALGQVHQSAYTEDAIQRVFAQAGVLEACTPRTRTPVICLSHDIDYLRPTLQMNLKRIISQRKWAPYPKGEHFMDSLERLLQIDRQAGQPGEAVSTLFIPCPRYSPNPLRWPNQWIIDPSYRLNEPLFDRLRVFIDQYRCEVGLHGSFYSIRDQFLKDERETLSHALGRPITCGRQHWLNLPGIKPLDIIHQSGIQVDSTLGWNGNVGFRGGMMRPFPIRLLSGQWIWEVPLVLMDGPLFDDLKLSAEEVVSMGKRLLEPVMTQGGCVAINWHERSAHSDYGWVEAYEKLTEWLASYKIEFKSIPQVVRERHEDCHPILRTHAGQSAVLECLS